MHKWSVSTSLIFPLCEKENETIADLFFECDVSTFIWKMLLHWMNITRAAMQELSWAEKWEKGRNPRECVYIMMLAGAVYHIWREKHVYLPTKESATNDLDQKYHSRDSL